jgi:peptidoglycan/LPS O-acetylase OafA/YrhL
MSATRGAHNNSFDLLRLILASCVIITHSYAILGFEERDLLYMLSNGQTKLSVFAVDSFFVISGYLVALSLYNSPGVLPYLAKRALRIVPAFWVTVLLSVVVLALITSESPLKNIFSGDSFRYVLNNLAFRIHYSIPGILEGKTINGSLWTIPYEAFLYVLIIPLWWVKRSSLRVVLLCGVLIAFLTLHFLAREALMGRSLPLIWLNIAELCRLGSLYLIGALLATVRAFSFERRGIAVLLAFILIVGSFMTGLYYYTVFVCIPVIILNLGMMYSKTASQITSNGDYSYGVYLWGFPVQQVIVHLTGIREPTYLSLTAIPIAYIIGMLSWHFIEYPFLRLKYLIQPQERSEA